VEAKSASRPYALPTKDSRALVEYVGATKETLATLPPVRLVVIVGPDSYTTTLPKKLRQLETASRVPARYLPAELLVDLRRKLRGPAPLPALLTSLLAADAVVKPRDISHVVHRDERRREAHERLVQELLVTSSSWTRP
jgi:hypothetical protein